MRKTILSFLEDFLNRGDSEKAFAHRRGLRMHYWSYAQIAKTAFKFARELEVRNVNKGDRVLIWSENSPEWVAAFFGCILRGAIVVPLDVESRPEFIRRVQQQVQARLLLSGSETNDKLINEIPTLRLPDLQAITSCHEDAPYQTDNITEQDTVEIIFTSGTTDEPKGVVLTHRNLLANISPLEHEIQKYLKWERLVHPIRFLNLVPLSHVFGQFMGIFVPQLLGGEVFFQESLSPTEIITTVRRERISVLVAVPRLLNALRAKIERDQEASSQMDQFQQALASADRSHFLKRWWIFRRIRRQFGWKFWAFVSGGATLDSETEDFWQRLGYAVLQGYGMTETASLISVNHPFKKSRGSIGKMLPGQEVCLDESGEILVRGENVSPGYWNASEQTPKTQEGWLRTGDMGAIDEAGNLYFKGRKKETIVTAAGLNIYPEDLEAALKRQPEVRDCAVISFDGPQGPEPLAVLIMKEKNDNAEDAIQRANQTLAQFQQIRRWHIWPESDFPRTATQKVRKRDIAEAIRSQMHTEDAKNRENLKNSLNISPVASLIKQIKPDAAPQLIGPSANLSTDLKLDSLGRVELMSAIEDRYQIDINEAAFTAATTLEDVEKIIHEGTLEDSTPEHSYPEWTQRFPVTLIRLVLFYILVLPITRLLCWVRVEGKEHLQDLRGPAIFISNHIAMVDHALILSALPGRYRRRMAIAMEGEILYGWRHPPEGTRWLTRARWLVQYALVVSLFNVFPLPKKSGFRRSFAYAGQSMDSGYSILVFPEGTRTEHGRVNPFMAGIGLLVSNLDAPVVPMRIKGLFELKGKRKYFAWPGIVTVTIGEPVKFAPDEEPACITKELERRVTEL